MSRQKRSQEAPVTLHVYDFRAPVLNGVLRQFGTGAFHCGVEVYGREWTFGNVSREGTGIFWNAPRSNMAHTYREPVLMGSTKMTRPQVERLLCVMKAKWPAESYHLVKRNCCHFSDEFCKKLGVGSIPSWVTNLAAVGAAAEEDLHMGRQALDKALALVGPDRSEDSKGERSRRHEYAAVSTSADGSRRSSTRAEGILCMRPWKMCLLLVLVLAGAVLGVVAIAQSIWQRRRAALSAGAEAPAAQVPVQTAPPEPETMVPPEKEAAIWRETTTTATADDCADRDEPLSEESRQRCCETRGLWCIYTRTSTTPVAKFDCEWERSEWRTAWSYEKQDWCCLHAHVGCEGRVPTPAPSPGPTPPRGRARAPSGSGSPATDALMDFDCDEVEALESWSEDRRNTCCLFRGIGCSNATAAAYGWMSDGTFAPTNGDAAMSANLRKGNSSVVGSKDTAARASNRSLASRSFPLVSH